MNDWFALFLLSLGTYTATKLIVFDVFPPVLWFRDKIVGGWREKTNKEKEKGRKTDATDADTNEELVFNKPVSWSPHWIRDLLSCPRCASGWVSAALTASTDMIVGLPVPVLLWLAAWSLGGLLASQEWA